MFDLSDWESYCFLIIIVQLWFFMACLLPSHSHALRGNNRLWIKEQLSLDPEEIIIDNPFFQRKTKRYKGCQIDYMIQTKYNTLYVCEIKFSRHPVGTKVIQEVKEKILRLSLPRGVSCRSVLIHVNGITEDLQDKDYFSDIIDFSELLAH